MNVTIRPYQRDFINAVTEDFKTHDKLLCVAPTGCLTGDSVVNINRARKGGAKRLDALYKSFHGSYRYRHDIKTMCRSLNESTGVIGLNEVIDVVQSGVKEVFRLTLSNGASLKATGCHRFMTESGYVRLDRLTNDSMIMVDTLKAVSEDKPNRIKRWDKLVQGMNNHPYSHSTTSKGLKIKRIEYHRLVCEAKMNGLSLNEFVRAIKNNKIDGLIFINPKTHHVHHLDMNHRNNSPENLTCLPVLEHLKYHSDAGGWKNFNQGKPRYSKLNRIERIGYEMTYDICCKEPNHNFVANGIVVHNSGKTVMFSYIIDEFIKNNPDKCAVIISHLSILVSQTAESLERFYGVKAQVLKAGQLPMPNARVIATTMQSFREADKILAWGGGDKAGMIVIDECFDNKTEILTEDGFVLFKDIGDANVAQVNKDNLSISFIKPIRIIEKKT